jgi:GNAT superfamily N-acetyltransferase
MSISDPELLGLQHQTARFECGSPALDDWLKHHALQAQRSDSTRVYVIHEKSQIVGFYALSAGSVRPEIAPTWVRKGLGRHDLPLVVLTRLAVHSSARGQGLGAALLEDALVRVNAAVDIVGARALHAHAKDESARSFYRHFCFESSPLDDNSLFLLMKDLRANIGAKRRQ